MIVNLGCVWTDMPQLGQSRQNPMLMISNGLLTGFFIPWSLSLSWPLPKSLSGKFSSLQITLLKYFNSFCFVCSVSIISSNFGMGIRDCIADGGCWIVLFRNSFFASSGVIQSWPTHKEAAAERIESSCLLFYPKFITCYIVTV